MKTNNNTNKQAAQLEKAQDLAIYNKVAEHARRAFARLVIRPGVYTPADIVKIKKQGAAFYTGDPDEVATVEVGEFSCTFSVSSALDLLAKLANAYHIPTAARVTFERTEKQADELRDTLEREAEEQRQREEAERLERERIEEEARRARIIEEGEELNARTFAGDFANLYAIAPELPTATNQAETATPEDVPALTIRESHHEEIRARLVMITAARWLLRAAAVVAAVLLVTLTPERTTTANADTLTAEPTPAPVLVIANTLTADTIASEADTLAVAVFEPVSVERAAAETLADEWADLLAAAAEAIESEADDLADLLAAAEVIESEADTLTVAALLTLTPDTLTREAVADSLTITTPADSLTADTVAVAPADTITTAALRVDTLEAFGEITAPDAADIDTSTTAPTSGTSTTATTGTPATMATPAPVSAPVAPVAPILIL